MKKLLFTTTLLLGLVAGFAQGRVNFANSATTLITTNGASVGQASGTLVNTAGRYFFGLYLGSVGTPENALQLNILATNVASAGRISGGNPASLAAPFAGGGTPLTFQIRGWSAAGGLSYEAALAAAAGGTLGLYGGVSPLGTVTATLSPNPGGLLFGTGAGQLSAGFELVPLVPEPSSIALGLLGLGAIALFRRRK